MSLQYTAAPPVTPVLPVATRPTMVNSWVDEGGGLFGNVRYYKDSVGIVHLQGCAKSGALGTTIFTLPVGFRPEATIDFAVVASNGSTLGTVRVGSDGTVQLTINPTGTNRPHLDQVEFRAA